MINRNHSLRVLFVFVTLLLLAVFAPSSSLVADTGPSEPPVAIPPQPRAPEADTTPGDSTVVITQNAAQLGFWDWLGALLTLIQ